MYVLLNPFHVNLMHIYMTQEPPQSIAAVTPCSTFTQLYIIYVVGWEIPTGLFKSLHIESDPKLAQN